MSSAIVLAPRDLNEAGIYAQKAAISGMFPTRRPEEALIVLMMGAELGLPPMQSMRNIYVVNGKPVLAASLLVALVRKSGLCASWRVIESTDTRCEIRTKRKGEEHEETCVWTIERANKAQLTNKPTWKQFPAQMLRARAEAELSRQVYPDVGISGIYTADEMGGDEPIEARVEVMEDPEREAIREEPQLEATAQPTLAQRIRDAQTLEALQTLAAEARQIPRGNPDRPVIAALLTERKRKMEATNE